MKEKEIDLDTIENDLNELCEDNRIMIYAINDYFLDLKDKGIPFKEPIKKMNKVCRDILEDYHDSLMENIDIDYFDDKVKWDSEDLKWKIEKINAIRKELSGIAPLTEEELKGRE